MLQAVPFDSLPQLVPAQLFGEAQSALVLQVVRQAPAVVSQPYGSQSEEVTVLHDPAPSQLRVGVNVEPAQVAGAQVVLAP